MKTPNTIRLPADLLEKLKTLAAERHTNLSELVRQILWNFFDSKEDKP